MVPALLLSAIRSARPSRLKSAATNVLTPGIGVGVGVEAGDAFGETVATGVVAGRTIDKDGSSNPPLGRPKKISTLWPAPLPTATSRTPSLSKSATATERGSE